MTFLLLIPAILSLLLLGAHSMRLGMPVLMAIPLGTLILLAWRQRWVARLAQVILVLGAAEWLRATLGYVSGRQAAGMPWGRLAVILGCVTLLTLLSSLVFQAKTLRLRYRLGEKPLLESTRTARR